MIHSFDMTASNVHDLHYLKDVKKKEKVVIILKRVFTLQTRSERTKIALSVVGSR